MTRLPSPKHLLGALVEDGVDLDLALKAADGYADARTRLDDRKTQLWLNTMVAALGQLGSYPSTTLTVFAYPSDHLIDHYNTLASLAGWKENADAKTT